MVVFWKLWLVALVPILKILFLAAVGAFLALDCISILKKNAKKHLNTMVYFVFFPALIYGSLARTISLKSFTMLWFMPINILLRCIIGTALGWLLCKITRVPRHLHGPILGCCAAGNLASLPMIVVPAICKEKSHPFGDVDVCYRNGLLYTSLTMAVGHIYAWSIVYSTIRMYSPNTNVIKFDEYEKNEEKFSKVSPKELEDKSLPNDQLKIECEVVDEQQKVVACIEKPLSVSQGPIQEKKNIMKRMKILADKINLKAIFAPALLAAIIGLVIGIVPQFQQLLVGETAPLRAIQASIVMLGDAGIPAMMLLVGANLLKGLKGLGKKVPVVVGVIAVEYIVLPAIGICIVKGAAHFNMVHHDPLYQFVLLLHYAVPPAISVSTMTQLLGVGDSECSLIMFATYSSAPFFLTLWWTLFMWLVL